MIAVFAYGQDRKKNITINKSKISVEQLLKEITKQTGLNFSYSPNVIDTDQKISFHVKNASLDETLKLFSEKTFVDYSIVEGQIVLNKKKKIIKSEQSDQEFFTLSGFIFDFLSGENLIGASILSGDRSMGTLTNEFGYYSISLPRGKHKIQCSYLGFMPQIENIAMSQNERMNIQMKSIPQKLPEITIELPVTRILKNNQPGITDIKQNELNNMPEFGGSSDLIKGLQARPGIKTHSDGSAFYYVRGGEKDQNLIIIDDAPIYNPAHLFGFYSLVVPDFTKSVQLYTNDIPVNLGDRLSSVLDIRTKDGNLKKIELNGATSFIMNRISLEGPLIKEKSSFFTSFRASNFNWLYKKYVPDLNLAFGDFSFKWNYKKNEKNRFFFTLINGRDVLENKNGTNSGIRWNNFAMTMRWNHIFNPKLFSNTILYTGNYQYQLSFGQDIWHSGIGNLSLKSDFTWYNSSKLTSKFGIELHGYFFNPGKFLQGSFNNLFPTIKQDHSRQSVLFYNTNFKFSNKWNFNAGARCSIWQNFGPASYYTFDEKHELNEEINTGQGSYNTYVRFDPRFSTIYNIDSSSVIKASYGLYHQFLNQITNSTSPFSSFEIWLPASPNIKPQAAHQFSIGYNKYISKKSIEFNAEVFYKIMQNQIDYAPHPHILLNPLIEGELRFGKMKSYGIEFTAKKEQGKFNGWISYSFSRAMRKTAEVNNGREYPAFQDRPHSFSAVMNYNFSKRFLFSVYYTVYSGSAFSSPTGFYNFNNIEIPVFSEKNNDRLPTYKRMDIAFRYELNKNAKSKFQHNLTFSIFNTLANKNIIDVNFNKTTDQNNKPIIRADLLAQNDLVVTRNMLVRFLPSLTYEFKLR
jgi:hypothetical protein